MRDLLAILDPIGIVRPSAIERSPIDFLRVDRQMANEWRRQIFDRGVGQCVLLRSTCQPRIEPSRNCDKNDRDGSQHETIDV